jgi:hypothetical protein
MDTSEIVATYGAAWNEPDEAKRAALLKAAFSDDGRYQDPMGIAEGRAALVAHIGGFHAGYPERVIDQASGVDILDGAGLRWAWVMRHGDQIELGGMDFAELAPDGRIQRIAVSSGRSRRSKPDPPFPRGSAARHGAG